MSKQLTYETFDTFQEAESYIKRNNLRSEPTWAENWFCWVVWYRE